MPTIDELNAGFSLGEFDVMPQEGRILRGNDEIRPEPQSWRVLLCLAQADGKLVSKDELIAAVWDGRAVSDDPINRAINQARKCFGDSGKESAYIETLPKMGYRLLQPVTLHKPSPDTQQAVIVHKQRRWKIASFILALVLVAIAFFAWSPEPNSTIAPQNSIAVLPFENLSGQALDDYLVAGFKAALVKSLHGMQDHVVKNSRVRYTHLEPRAIADLLGVESLLTATLERDGTTLRVTYEVTRNGQVVFTDHVYGQDNDIFALQEQFSRVVRAEFGDTAPLPATAERRPQSDAYDSYMRGDYALERRGANGALRDAIKLFRSAIEKDRNFGPSYLGLATAYALLPDYPTANSSQDKETQWQQAHLDALTTINAGIARDPGIEDSAAAIFGFIRHKEKRWQESEQAYLRAIDADVVDANAFNWYSRMLASVGRTDDALLQALKALQIDPSSAVINSRVAIIYALLDESEKALEYFERSKQLGAGGVTHSLAFAFLLARNARFDEARELVETGMQSAGFATSWVGPVIDGYADATKIPAALAILEKAAEAGDVPPQAEVIVRAHFGDIDGALQLASRLEGPGEIFEMDLLFVNELEVVRRQPEFLALLQRLGITQYWAENNCVFEDDKVECLPD